MYNVPMIGVIHDFCLGASEACIIIQENRSLYIGIMGWWLRSGSNQVYQTSSCNIEFHHAPTVMATSFIMLNEWFFIL